MAILHHKIIKCCLLDVELLSWKIDWMLSYWNSMFHIRLFRHILALSLLFMRPKVFRDSFDCHFSSRAIRNSRGLGPNFHLNFSGGKCHFIQVYPAIVVSNLRKLHFSLKNSSQIYPDEKQKKVYLFHRHALKNEVPKLIQDLN